jgi:predicted nucleic acid-binding protein
MFYVDSSAIVKLVVEEAESPALESWFTSGVTVVTSQLAEAEVIRAVRRRAAAAEPTARAVLATLNIARLRVEEYGAAQTLTPVGMRSLDALHLAAALTLRPDLEALVTYDERLALAAVRHGVAVISPGR